MSKKFREQTQAEKFMQNTFLKLQGAPGNSDSSFTAGDNLLKQKLAFDKMAAKHA